MSDELAMTRRLLVDAGLRPGMRVLDVGCGRGEVTRLAAELVGPTGSVLGVDRDARWLAEARARAGERGLDWVRVRCADVGDLGESDGPFDAVTGRRVLMYQRDAVTFLRHLTRLVTPEGVLVFQETDATMVPASLVELPLHAAAYRWIWQTVEREGADPHMGFHLAGALERAGWQVIEVRAEAVVQTPRSRHRLAEIVSGILPRIEAQGVATRAEIDPESLDQRLEDELRQTGATLVGDVHFGAWARRDAATSR